MKQTYVKLTVFILLILGVLSARGQMPQPFSADVTISMANGRKMTGKYYFSPPKFRMDMNSMDKAQGPFGGNVSMIMDLTTQTSYMLMPQMQMYMETHGTSDRMSPGMKNLENLSKG